MTEVYKEDYMSLYLGKDSVGNSVLHTTRASLGESVMKSGVNEYTTFHSSLPYVQLVKIIPVSHSKSGTFNGQWYNYDFKINLPAEAITLARSGYLFTIVVSTQNSGGQRVGVHRESTFVAQIGVSPSYVYVWPAQDIPDSGSLSITRSDPGGVLYTGDQYGGSDVIYSAELVFYNIINTNLDIKNNVNEIILSPSEFSIKTPTHSLDLATFSPVRVSSSVTATSFRPDGGSVYIEPRGSLIKPVKGWILDSSNSNNCIIQKILTDNTVETIVSNSTKNIIYTGATEYGYYVSAAGSLGSSPGLFTIAQDEMVVVFTNGTFSSAVVGTILANGAAPFIGNSNGSYKLSTGDTVHVDNGSYACDRYVFYLSVVNGVAYLKNNAAKWCSGDPIAGTFSGTMKVLKFKIV